MNHSAISRVRCSRRAFTLIELSIVLVIIGLIVGGVLVGRDLVRAAELRKVISEVDTFKTAAGTFRLKFNCYPGDCMNAATFFGNDTGGCPHGQGIGTCNGDGNDKIIPRENFRFWEQLALAGLIQGVYTGAMGPIGQFDHEIDVNVPGSSISDAGYWIWYKENNFGWPAYYNTFLGNFVTLSAEYSGVLNTQGYLYETKSFLPSDAYAVDSKADDGKPGTGKVMSNWDMDCTDSASDTDFTGDYRVSLKTKACLLVFPRMF